jgi:hypothetical protein
MCFVVTVTFLAFIATGCNGNANPSLPKSSGSALSAAQKMLIGVWKVSGAVGEFYIFNSDGTYIHMYDVNGPDGVVAAMAKAGKFGKSCLHYGDGMYNESNLWLDTCPCDAQCIIGGEEFEYEMSADGKTLTMLTVYPVKGNGEHGELITLKRL